MKESLLHHPGDFGWGYTPVTRIDRAEAAYADLGIDFGIWKLRAGEEHDLASGRESAWLLLNGRVTWTFGSTTRTTERRSIFDEDPYALHCAAGAPARLRAETDCELAICRVENERRFETVLFGPQNMMESEHRGKGLLDGTMYRIVRAIFDTRNRPEANLVLGEVINFPGRWSSYPPHHHPQPEFYHYRFTRPEGYGHAEGGDRVYRVRQNDTLLIHDGEDHPQVAAPGYGMYYIWSIRHLPGNPYKGPAWPEFTEAHRWTLDPATRVWRPEGIR